MKIFRYFTLFSLLAAFGAGCFSAPKPTSQGQGVVPIQATSTEAVGDQATSSVPDQNLGPQMAVLILNNARVTVVRKGANLPEADNQSLYGGDVVDVASGTALLVYPNAGASSLPAPSRVVIAQAGQGSGTVMARMQLEAGSIWTRFERLLGTDEHFSVEANGVVATVRGTAFGVQIQGNTADVQVGEHVVDVTAASSSTPGAKRAAVIRLTEGRGMKVDKAMFATMERAALERKVRKLQVETKTDAYRFMRTKLSEDILDRGIQTSVSRIPEVLPSTSSPSIATTTSREEGVVFNVADALGRPLANADVMLFPSGRAAQNVSLGDLLDDMNHPGLHDAAGKTDANGRVAFRLKVPVTLVYRVKAEVLGTGTAYVKTDERELRGASLIRVLFDEIRESVPSAMAPLKTLPLVETALPVNVQTPDSPTDFQLSGSVTMPILLPEVQAPVSVDVGVVGSSVLVPGQRTTLQANLRYSDGASTNITSQCSWFTSDVQKGTIDRGVFTAGTLVGEVEVMCRYLEGREARIGQTTLTVRQFGR